MNIKSDFIVGALAVVVIGVISFMAMGTTPQNNTEQLSEQSGITAVIYKSPTCTCCVQYGSYLGKKGYSVDTRAISDMRAIKAQYGVPYELESCHTMEIGGYVVEGHIPEEAIQKLLTEKPDIKGIGMAGMPSGSPGMPGPKLSDFVIYEINHDGTKGDVFMTI